MIDEEFTLMHKALISRAKTYRSNKALLARFTTKYNESLVNGNLTSEQVLAAEQCKKALSSMVEAERNSLVAINKALSTYYIESLKQNSLEFLSEDPPKIESTTNSKPSSKLILVTEEFLYEEYIDAETFYNNVSNAVGHKGYKAAITCMFNKGRKQKVKTIIRRFAKTYPKHFMIKDNSLYHSKEGFF